ncbi:hypothetical protein [Dokdonella sp.]|uniref:hypothetical protein n=1 Tax=Dokdonella sp. TaxID=2291710 RepID=UPI0025B97A6E|nr:hypothetical protein [Dokdonella sp.]MBX3690159.1 hypothetical protein [Dokdonella sp.]
MKFRLATLLLALMPLAAVGQSLPVQRSATPLVDQLLRTDGVAPGMASGQPVLPIWSGTNGELLAVVPLPGGWVAAPTTATPAYAGPSTWRLAGHSVSASGLSLDFANGLRLDALIGRYLPNLPACAVGSCAFNSPTSQGASSAVLGMGWSSAEGALDLSYGLSWLRTSGQASAAEALFSPLSVHEKFGDPRWLGLASEESSLFARGRWRFSQATALDLTASYGRLHDSRMAGAMLPALDLDQLSLSLGLDVGSLRGAIVGHVLSSDDPLLAGKRWTTLDLGISWRTPWAGELSVGAQNILATPSASPRDVDGQARTPYIQYRQDL